MAIKDKKIVKLIKSWFNFNEPDPNVLVQKVKSGFVVKVYSGFKLAIQHSNGLISVHGPGLVFVPPLTRADIVADHSLSREFSYKDNKKTRDNITVEAHENISYEYSVMDDDTSVCAVVGEPTADAIIQKYVQDIVTLIVTNSYADKIKHGFDVDVNSLPSWLDFDSSKKLRDIFQSISKYGCRLENIHICDFNEPKAIIDAETARKQQEIQLQTELERAQGERKIELFRAQTANLVSTYHYRVLHWVATQNNLLPSETLELIRADLLKNSNVVNVMGVANVDAMAAAVYQRYCQQYSNGKGASANEPIDTTFEETGPSLGK